MCLPCLSNGVVVGGGAHAIVQACYMERQFSSQFGMGASERHPHLWSRVGSDACVGIADVSSHRRYHLLLFFTFSDVFASI